MATPAAPRATSGNAAAASAPNAATVMAEQANQLQQQQQQIAELMAAINLMQVGANSARGQGGTIGKDIKPEKYEGEQDGLQPFITGMMQYFSLHSSRFEEDYAKVAGTYPFMKGRAAVWMQPYMQDYLENANTSNGDLGQCKTETRRLFEDWEEFTEEMVKMFGDIDAAKQAARKIGAIRQRDSVSKYAIAFRHLQAKISWDDEPLREAFYNGLKETIKDELTHYDDPEDLQEMVALAIKIDNRLYARKQYRKQGERYAPLSGKGKETRPNRQQWRRDRDGDVEMADQASAEKKKPNGISDKERQKRYDNKACLRCGEVGHFKRECPKKPKYENAKAATIQVSMAIIEFDEGIEENRTPGIEFDNKVEDNRPPTPYPGTTGLTDWDRIDDLLSGSTREYEDSLVDVPVMSEDDEREESEPPEVTADWVLARLEEGNCWICGSDEHVGQECRKTVSVKGPRAMEVSIHAMSRQGPATRYEQYQRNKQDQEDLTPENTTSLVNELARQLDKINSEQETVIKELRKMIKPHEQQQWFECTEHNCRRHRAEKQEIMTRPGEDSHMLIENRDCKVAECHTHAYDQWQKTHTMERWFACYDDACTMHKEAKHVVGWWASGPDSGTPEEECEDEECMHEHDREHEWEITWDDCTRAECEFHRLYKLEAQYDMNDILHAYATAEECKVDRCAIHALGPCRHDRWWRCGPRRCQGHRDELRKHGNLHWTNCHEDECPLHRSDKRAGYCPQPRKN